MTNVVIPNTIINHDLETWRLARKERYVNEIVDGITKDVYNDLYTVFSQRNDFNQDVFDNDFDIIRRSVRLLIYRQFGLDHYKKIWNFE